MMKQLVIFSLFISFVALSNAQKIAAPAPYGAIPTARQLKWHDLEQYSFVHFSPNTFTNKEWGYGDEPESIFNPTDFDADRIVTCIKAAGFQGVMIHAKPKDGF